LIKFTYFIFYKKLSTIKNLIYIFTKVIFLNYGLLKEIIFNKDKLFILKF
ncbi:uncharacterized protein CCOS01_16904, partial [Colletotrichum costaricense]